MEDVKEEDDHDDADSDDEDDDDDKEDDGTPGLFLFLPFIASFFNFLYNS